MISLTRISVRRQCLYRSMSPGVMSAIRFLMEERHQRRKRDLDPLPCARLAAVLYLFAPQEELCDGVDERDHRGLLRLISIHRLQGFLVLTLRDHRGGFAISRAVASKPVFPENSRP